MALSRQEKLEIQMLFAEGLTQGQIASRLGVSQAAVKRVKVAKQVKLPKHVDLRTLIGRCQHLINMMIRGVLLEEEEASIDVTMQIYKLTNTIKNLEEIDESVSLRDRVMVSEQMLEWMIRKGYSGTLEQIQEYHDEHLSFM
jgi:predicted transcriptional regulator